MVVCETEINGHSYSPFAARWFDDCLYTDADWWSFYVGLASIFVWMAAQIPQLYTNHKLRRADSLSPLFLVVWLLGDATNFIGCVLTQCIATQLLAAVYFVFVDVLMVASYMYWAVLYPEAERKAQALAESERLRQRRSRATLLAVGFVGVLVGGGWSAFGGGVFEDGGRGLEFDGRPLLHGVGRRLLAVDSAPEPESTAQSVGMAVGWLSAALYLGSRLPQILKNFRRRSTEGLSRVMFACAIVANVLYSLSIFIRSTDGEFLAARLPWIVGSLGVVSLDIVLFCQFIAYRRPDKPRHRARELDRMMVT